MEKGNFQIYVQSKINSGQIILQPRMGFICPKKMRAGLQLVKELSLPNIGTITVDSFTRTGQIDKTYRAIENNYELNGYPICSYGEYTNKEMINNLIDKNFAIQVRHGSPSPIQIFSSLIDMGIDATEGGPVSYCLPYSSMPLKDSIDNWKKCCQMLSDMKDTGIAGHLETFGGCLLGQLCHPSLLVAMSIIEGIFFVDNNVRSISLSYAQNYNSLQDIGALLALRKLALKFFSKVDWHIVSYCFMGKFPESEKGGKELISDNIRVAIASNVERLIVKTFVESKSIPNIYENKAALNFAYSICSTYKNEEFLSPNQEKKVLLFEDQIYHQALKIIERTLDIHNDISAGIISMFEYGYIDIPYCIHQDNKKMTSVRLRSDGEIEWGNSGNMSYVCNKKQTAPVSSSDFLRMLNFNNRKYDHMT